MEDTTTWFLPGGTEANPAQYFNIPPVVLLIPQPFNMPAGDTGTYTCSLDNMQDASFRDTIMLNALSMCMYTCAIMCMHVHMCVCVYYSCYYCASSDT